jgi:hypothetical protein
VTLLRQGLGSRENIVVDSECRPHPFTSASVITHQMPVGRALYKLLVAGPHGPVAAGRIATDQSRYPARAWPFLPMSLRGTALQADRRDVGPSSAPAPFAPLSPLR